MKDCLDLHLMIVNHHFMICFHVKWKKNSQTLRKRFINRSIKLCRQPFPGIDK